MSSLTLSPNLNMENVFPDPLHQQIFSHLSPRRGELPIHVVETIAGNISFLIKYTAGYKVVPSQVSVSVVDVRGPDNGLLGHKAMVCIHGAPGRFKVVVTKEVAHGRNVIIGLSEKVDRVVRDIISKEGNDGYGDF